MKEIKTQRKKERNYKSWKIIETQRPIDWNALECEAASNPAKKICDQKPPNIMYLLR